MSEENYSQYEKVRYKTVANKDYYLYIKRPETKAPQNGFPTIIFFFGGGWVGGDPSMFASHASMFAAKGFFTVLAEYRVKERDGIDTPGPCIMDGKSAIRWLRENHSFLNIDPTKITAVGGSAGGHVALSAAVFDGFNEITDNLSVSAVPDYIILFNAVLNVSAEGYTGMMENRPPEELVKFSPYHHIKAPLPPILIFHGYRDTMVPVQNARDFYEKVSSFGGFIKYVEFEDEEHALVKFSSEKTKERILVEMTNFLVGVSR